jgi:hypothetical protein
MSIATGVRRLFLAALCILLGGVGLAGTRCLADDALTAVLKESRTPLQDDAARTGLEVVERRLTLGNVGFRYRQVVDPAQGDQPVAQKYGDYFLACGFPQGTWNWNNEYFLDVLTARGASPACVANKASLQEGTYVLEQGLRAVGEMVWTLPGAASEAEGRMVLRVVKRAEAPTWFYLRVALEGDASAQLRQITLMSYPYVTSAPRERQRWASTLTRAFQVLDPPAAVDSAAEWGIVLHNKNAHETGGALIVVDPAEVAAATVWGTYCVSVGLTPKPGHREVHLALGYFWDAHYAAAVEAFRGGAPGVLAELRELDWTVRLDPAAWARERQAIEELLASAAANARYGSAWDALNATATRLLTPPATAGAATVPAPLAAPGDDRRFSLLLKQASDLRAQLYGVALDELIRDAAR